VRKYFVLTHWEDASTSYFDETRPDASCHRTLYRRETAAWSHVDLEAFGDEPLLDAGADGSEWIQNVEDDGCCGWSNESSDQTVLAGVDSVLFDEWSTLHNRDYDVSFFAVNARISPEGKRVGLTLGGGVAAGEEIRLSAEGRADSTKLESIRRASRSTHRRDP
jgi:hypothetical protein